MLEAPTKIMLALVTGYFVLHLVLFVYSVSGAVSNTRSATLTGKQMPRRSALVYSARATVNAVNLVVGGITVIALYLCTLPLHARPAVTGNSSFLWKLIADPRRALVLFVGSGVVLTLLSFVIRGFEFSDLIFTDYDGTSGFMGIKHWMQQGNVASPTYSSRLVTMFVGINIISALLVGVKVMVLLAMYAYRENLPREKGERKFEDYSHGDQEKTLSKEQQTEQKPIVQTPEKTLQRYKQPDQEPPKEVPETSPMRQAKDIPKRLSKDMGEERPESLVTGQLRIMAGESAKGQTREMPKQPHTTDVHKIQIQLIGQPVQEQPKDAPGQQLKMVSRASVTEQPKQEPMQPPQVYREQPKKLAQEPDKYIGPPGEQPGAAPKAQPRPQVVQALEKTLQRFKPPGQEPPKGVSEKSPMRQAKDLPERLSTDQGQERPESLVTGQQKIMAGEPTKVQVRELPKQPPKQPVQEQLKGASRRYSGPESRDSHRIHVHEIQIQLPGQQVQEPPKGVSEKSPMRQAKYIPERLSKDQGQERLESLVTGQQKIMDGEPTKVQVREMPKQLPKQPVQEQPKGVSRRYSGQGSRDSHRMHVHEIQIQLPGQQVQEPPKGVPEKLPMRQDIPKRLSSDQGQEMPWQGMSAQGIPAHGISVLGVQGMPGQGIPGKEIRGQGMQEQGIQAQVLPRQGMTGQEIKMQGMQGQGMQGQWMQGRRMPGKGITEQGMPGQGIPGQRMQGQGMQGQMMPGQGWPAQGMPAQGMPKQGMPAHGVSEPALPRRGVPADRMSSPLLSRDQEAVMSGSAESPPVGDAAQQHAEAQAPLPSTSQERRQKGMARRFYMYYK